MDQSHKGGCPQSTLILFSVIVLGSSLVFNSVPNLKRKLQQYSINLKLSSKSQKEAPAILNQMETQFQISKRKLQAILNQMETQFQISKGSSSNTKSNGNSSLPILNQFESPTKTLRVCLNRVPLTGSIVRGGGGSH